MKRPVGTRSSERREAIHRFVAAQGRHPSAEEILGGVRRKIPGMGLATVYRNLEILVAAGRLARTVHDGVARYDARTDPHHHFNCEQCGSVTNMDVAVPRQVLRTAARQSGGSVRSLSIELRGICGRCRGR